MNETLDDIVAWIREVAQGFRRHSAIHNDITIEGLRVCDALDRIADRVEAATKRECGEMRDTIVRIGNWCAQDLAENAYVSDISGNYLKTLNGLCEVCRPFMQRKGGGK